MFDVCMVCVWRGVCVSVWCVCDVCECGLVCVYGVFAVCVGFVVVCGWCVSGVCVGCV